MQWLETCSGTCLPIQTHKAAHVGALQQSPSSLEHINTKTPKRVFCILAIEQSFTTMLIEATSVAGL